MGGLIAVFSGVRAIARNVPVTEGHIVLGRPLFSDEMMSRVHAEIAREGDAWVVRDLGSRHGTFVDGARVEREVVVAAPRVIRLAHTILVPAVPVVPFVGGDGPGAMRVEEIPHHVVEAIAGASAILAPHVRLVEACMLRSWPGGAPELREEVHRATLRAAVETIDRVMPEHLAPAAGAGEEAPRRRSYIRWSLKLTREDVEKVLTENEGNVALAARALGMQRTQLYREMERLGIERPARVERR